MGFINETSTKNYFITSFLLEKVLREEERLDGIFIIKSTAFDLLPEELIQQYKNLTGVEKAFKEIKDFLRLRPIHHHEDNREENETGSSSDNSQFLIIW